MFITLQDIPSTELIPGYTARIIHSAHMTFVHWDAKQGAPLPEHSHPHEQVVHVLEGQFELTINGETQVMKPGKIAVIPPDVPHSGRALTACRILDVFYPLRDDYHL